MEELCAFLNRITLISDRSWCLLESNFSVTSLKKFDFFSKTNEVSTKIGFLQRGVVRSYFINQKAQEYNKNFFLAPSLVGAYTSLITNKPNQLAQQALTECTIWEADYVAIKQLYTICPDLERLGRIQAEHFFVEKEIGTLTILVVILTYAGKRLLPATPGLA